MRWITEVKMVNSVDDLQKSQSIRGHRFTDFEMLDAKIVLALKKIIPNSSYRRRSFLKSRRLKGMADSFTEESQVTCTRVAILDCSVLFGLSLHGDDVQVF